MGKLDGLKIGWCICASFCNFQNTEEVIKRIKNENNVEILPILTENAQNYDTRFGKADDFIERIEQITQNKVLRNLVDVEPLGPKNMVDLIVVLPCSGNTMAKIANGIIDNTVVSAIKSIRRVNKPVILAVSSNDILGINFINLGLLVNIKDIYFVPMKMDNPVSKPNSLVSDFNLLEETIEHALRKEQLEPILL